MDETRKDAAEITALFQSGINALRAGRANEAEDMLSRVLELAPEHAGALNGMGLLMAQRGERAEAERLWRLAVNLAPSFSAPYVNLANLFRATAPLEAIEHYQRGIALAPDDAQAVFGLASLLERVGRPMDAADVAEQALERFAGHPGLMALAARGMIERGRAIEARAMLAPIDVSRVPPRLAQMVLYTLVLCEDRLDNPQAALAAAARGADLLDALFPSAAQGAPVELADIKALAAHYSVNPPSHDPSGAGADMVFLVGFPMSGSERLAKVLERHPKIDLKNDNPALSVTARSLFGSPTIPRVLNDHELTDARARFARSFGEMGGNADGGAQVRIDHVPLHITLVGVAAELFPAARFVVARREPPAACLAASMKSYELTPLSAHLTRFSNASIMAAAVEQGWHSIRDALAPRMMEIAHEDIVGSPRDTLARVMAYIGIEGAPSAEAVATLTEQADPPIGDWRRYEPHLPPDALRRLTAI